MLKKTIVLVCFCSILGGTILFAISYRNFWDNELNVAEESVFYIAPGALLSTVAENLSRDDYISRPLILRILFRLEGYDKRLKAGRYRVPPGMSVREFASIVSSGRAIPDDVTLYIREGATVEEIIQSIDAITAVAEVVSIDAFSMGKNGRPGFV